MREAAWCHRVRTAAKKTNKKQEGIDYARLTVSLSHNYIVASKSSCHFFFPVMNDLRHADVDKVLQS